MCPDRSVLRKFVLAALISGLFKGALAFFQASLFFHFSSSSKWAVSAEYALHRAVANIEHISEKVAGNLDEEDIDAIADIATAYEESDDPEVMELVAEIIAEDYPTLDVVEE